ncbi:predicted protein [Lichtheimia corymbifera JMRC:FSU:9682]|uniref:Uncharacterized protein n=1 Tax=Lichtheimia corymbifera JMRC:FSU:9682 TaxID=1263082 RepID=A0A068RE28_9FUNG|nr:predicted protein [Lichtheimia corymbifera JMRC:FSU:9682]
MPFVIPPPPSSSSQQDPTIDDDITASPILVPTDIVDFATTTTTTAEGGNVDVDSSSNSSSSNSSNTSATTNIPLSSTPFLDSNNDDDNDPFAFLHPSWLSRTDSDPYRRYRLPRPPSPIHHHHHHASSRPTSTNSSTSTSSSSSSSSTQRMRHHHRPTFRSIQQQLASTSPPTQRRYHWSIPAAAASSSSSSNLAATSDETSAAEAAVRARRRLRAFNQRGLPTRTLRRSSYRTLQYCLGDNASSFYNDGIRRSRSTTHGRLDFCVVMEDGGRYSSYYSVENILRNDDSVYCSGRSGTINILLQYCGSPYTNPIFRDKSCVISRIIIKSPQHGFTAPCNANLPKKVIPAKLYAHIKEIGKEGMFFVSHAPIDVDATSKFDHFTRRDYQEYVDKKGGQEMLDDSDPVAWFCISDNRQDVIELNDRASKYVLIKLIRAENESENIDLQHVALIGYCGARAFGSARLC